LQRNLSWRYTYRVRILPHTYVAVRIAVAFVNGMPPWLLLLVIVGYRSLSSILLTRRGAVTPSPGMRLFTAMVRVVLPSEVADAITASWPLDEESSSISSDRVLSLARLAHPHYSMYVRESRFPNLDRTIFHRHCPAVVHITCILWSQSPGSVVAHYLMDHVS